MRKVKLPEVTKEEAEATLMVLFTTPLKRLGLDTWTHTQRQTSLCYKQGITHTKSCQEEKSTIVLGENVARREVC